MSQGVCPDRVVIFSRLSGSVAETTILALLSGIDICFWKRLFLKVFLK